jgi:CHASE1-domain containing sensor protein
MQPPPDTLSYMLLGFGVIFFGLAVLILSLIVRFRNLRRDVEILKDIEAGKED